MNRKNLDTILNLSMSALCVFIGVLWFIASALIIITTRSDPNAVLLKTVFFVALCSFLGIAWVIMGIAGVVRSLKERHNK